MDVKILGAGYGGVRCALDLHRKLGSSPDVRITLVDKHHYHQFRTELHKAAAGTTTVEEVRIPLKEIFAGTSVRLLQAEVKRLLIAEKKIELGDGMQLSFDRLVVALGSDPEYFSIPGLSEYGITLRSLNSARLIREHIEAMLKKASEVEDSAERERLLTIVVGGGGLTGVEFVTELVDRMPDLIRMAKLGNRKPRLILIEATPEILRGFDQRLVRVAERRMKRRGVEVRLGEKIVRLLPDRVVLEGGEEIPAGSFVWTGGIRGSKIVERAMSTRARGRAVVNEYLQSVDSSDVFVIGDAALAINSATGQPVAPTAQNAIMQGRLVARNICAQYHGEPLLPYRAQNFGVVASLGKGYGLAQIKGLGVAGAGAAVLKDLITLRYTYSIGGPRLIWRRALGLQNGTVHKPGDQPVSVFK